MKSSMPSSASRFATLTLIAGWWCQLSLACTSNCEFTIAVYDSNDITCSAIPGNDVYDT